MRATRAGRCLAVAGLLLAAAAGAAASDAYRLLQASVQSHQIGCRTYSAQGYLSLPRPGGNTFKAVMVLEANATSPDVLAGYTQQKNDLSGVLVLLPAQQAGAGAGLLGAEAAASLAALEQQLLAAPTSVPVFFAAETPELAAAVFGTAALFARGAPPSQHSDRFNLQIQGTLPTQVRPQQAINYVASLRATDDQFKPGVPIAPTLLITAHYDAFTPAPAAPGGADAAGSGAAAALLLLRLLHRLFASPEARPGRNVLVVLTAGGPHGQEGLRQWLADADPAQLEAIEAAVVLDSIGASAAVQQQQQQQQQQSSGGGGRRLHAHHAASDGARAWLAALSDAAERQGLQLSAVAGSASDGASIAWGSEHLAAKGVPAVTLSSLAAPPARGLGGAVRLSSLGDTSAGVDFAAVLEAVQVVADAATRWLYPHLDSGLRLLDVSSEPQQHADFLRSWVGLLEEAANMLPFDQVEASGAVLHDSLRAFMRGHSQGALKRHAWSPAGGAAALTAWTGGSALLKVHASAGYMQDMLLTAAVIIYLVGLYVGLSVAVHGWAGLTAALSPAPARRARGGGSSRRS